MARTRLAALLLAACVACSTLRGAWRTAEEAAPAAIGAGVGVVVGGPVGAVVGAAAGDVTGQAVRGNVRQGAQDEAIEDAIRGGQISITPGMVIAEFGFWIVAIGIALWLLRTPQSLVGDIVRFVRKKIAGKAVARGERRR